MALDPVKNFAISRVATAPSPATSGTTLVVDEGDGALFPAPATSGEFNVVVYPNGEQPDSSNAEIVRVTARTADTMTITREQEGTSARTIGKGDIVMLGITAKIIGDIGDVVESAETAATDAEALITEFNGGWVDAQETWTYASADDPTFTFTVAADVTTKYSAGMKIKLTQSTVKYFIVTAVSTYSGGNTTITVYGGTDYDLADAAISSNYYSTQKAPQGFPLNPAKWSVEATDTNTETQATPTDNVWYNLGSISLSVPIGSWKIGYSVLAGASKTSTTILGVQTTLSTANNSESETKLSGYFAYIAASGNITLRHEVYREFYVSLSSKASYYLNTKTGTESVANIYNYGSILPTRIFAICAYL